MSVPDEERCENPVSVERFWPGKEPDLVCLEHAQQSRAIAQVMGFHLALRPFGVDANDVVSGNLHCCACTKIEARR